MDNKKYYIQEPKIYHKIHFLFRSKKKKKCEFCKEAPVKIERDRLQLALKKGKKHAFDIKNYLTLCSSCHKKYDMEGKPAHNKGVRTVKPKVCEWCKKSFHPIKIFRRFCSNQCSHDFQWAGYTGKYVTKVHPLKHP